MLLIQSPNAFHGRATRKHNKGARLKDRQSMSDLRAASAAVDPGVISVSCSQSGTGASAAVEITLARWRPLRHAYATPHTSANPNDFGSGSVRLSSLHELQPHGVLQRARFGRSSHCWRSSSWSSHCLTHHNQSESLQGVQL